MRKTLCMILVFLIVLFNIFYTVNAEETNELQNEQQVLQNQITDAAKRLEDIKSELSENLQQVQKLDEKIITSKSELQDLNTKIEELQKSINDTQEKLNIVEEKYNIQKESFETRLIAIYETGDIQYLDVILKSKNISEFLSNYFLIEQLTTYDYELLDEMKIKKDKIESEKNKLEKNKQELAIIKENQTKTSRILENTKTVRENFISKLSNTEKNIQTDLDEYMSRFEAINSEILLLVTKGLDTQYIGGELAWPVPGYTRITSQYGMRTHPITGIYKLHTGIDISAPMGANFIAANDGIVIKASYNSAYGNMVIVDHGGGVSTLYAHGSEILVQVGQTVKRGETILRVGSTGYSTGPHAHFEVRLNGIVTNPLPYITNGLVPETQQKNTQNEIIQ